MGRGLGGGDNRHQEQTATPPPDLKFTQQITAFNVTVYYPDIMRGFIQDEINFYFEDDSADTFAITPPQAFDEFWGIPQSDLSTMTTDFYAQLVSNHTDTVVMTQITAISIGSYPANYFVLQNEGVYTLFVYVFETPLGIFNARLETHEADYLPKTDLIHRLEDAKDVSGMPDGVIARPAPAPDVRMGERITSLDGFITYQMPFGWVFDTTSAQADLFADSQATLDSLNDGFNIPARGLAVGMITPNFLDDIGLTSTTPYTIIQELRTILRSNADTQPAPLWYYANLPYEAYVQELESEFF